MPPPSATVDSVAAVVINMPNGAEVVVEPSDSRISLTEAADRLGVHYMTAYRYVRTGRLPAEKVGQEWRVDPDDVRALRDGRPDEAAVGRGRRRDRTTELVDRLTRADEVGAWSIIDDAIGGGMDPADVYLELLVPALALVGHRWASGEITVGQEHQASGVVLRLIGRLGPRFARRGRKRGTLIVGAPPGDVHGLPSALLSDLLRSRGFDVVDLGADVPAASWATTCASVAHLAGVGIGASTPDNDAAIATAIAAIRTETSVPIVLGGNAVTDEAHARRLGASAYSATFQDAVDRLDTPGTAEADPATPRTAS